MAIWAKKLFNLMQRNATPTTSFFRIPPGSVIEIGIQVQI
jgi:KUP system potassium uptake protein